VTGGSIVREETTKPETVVPRRTALAVMGAAGAAVVAACSNYSESSGSAPEAPAAAAGSPLGAAADVPVGGGKVFTEQKVVVTQPAKGKFAAFSAVCTHQGCIVDEVKDGTINCPCHGSKFKIADGSVAAGPAPKPLETKKVTVASDKITLA
jgi:Rieske Fe-S protein